MVRTITARFRMRSVRDTHKPWEGAIASVAVVAYFPAHEDLRLIAFGFLRTHAWPGLGEGQRIWEAGLDRNAAARGF